ncbi:MAG: DUF1848 family protein [Desulfobacterales bacterium]
MNTATKTKNVLSASRRTDIPAFYLTWFMHRLERGFFEVVNPFNQRVALVPAGAEAVHSIVFWSKDYGRFLKDQTGEELRRRGYGLFFNFTVNSAAPLLEPRVPPLEERLAQLETLSRRFGPQSINWRFDPLCFYRRNGGSVENNLADFSTIALRAHRAGITRCITSFMDHYPKIRRRLAALPGIAFVDPASAVKAAVLLDLETRLRPLQIDLHLCCEKDILQELPAETKIRPSACIPNSLLTALYGGRTRLKKDPGQRRGQGCGCQVSVDIGSYRDQPCGHGCLFCYANPHNGTDRSATEKPDPCRVLLSLRHDTAKRVV